MVFCRSVNYVNDNAMTTVHNVDASMFDRIPNEDMQLPAGFCKSIVCIGEHIILYMHACVYIHTCVCTYITHKLSINFVDSKNSSLMILCHSGVA